MNQTKERKISALQQLAALAANKAKHEQAARDLAKANAIVRKPT